MFLVKKTEALTSMMELQRVPKNTDTSIEGPRHHNSSMKAFRVPSNHFEMRPESPALDPEPFHRQRQTQQVACLYLINSRDNQGITSQF